MEPQQFKIARNEPCFSNIAKVDAKSEEPHAVAATEDNTSGLQKKKTVYLCKNGKVTLTVNLNVKYGLFNRSPGRVIDIIYLEGRRPPYDLADFVMVEFQQYSGPPFIESNSKVQLTFLTVIQ